MEKAFLMMNYIEILSHTAGTLGLPAGTVSGDPVLVNDCLAQRSNHFSTTLHIMQHIQDYLPQRCHFLISSNRNMQNRYSLPDNRLLLLPVSMLTASLKNGIIQKYGISRICIQTTYHERTIENLLDLLIAFRLTCSLPITVNSVPISATELNKLKTAGLDAITVVYKSANSVKFSKIRQLAPCIKPDIKFRWEAGCPSIDDAIAIFGKGKVSSHLILGKGESHQEVLHFIQSMNDKHVPVCLKNYFKNTNRHYFIDLLQLQIAHYLIRNQWVRSCDFKFDSNGNIVRLF